MGVFGYKDLRMFYETRFLIALLLTLIIEIPVLLVFCKLIFRLKIKSFRIIFAGFLASVLTLPYLWFVLPAYINSVYYIYIGETLVFLFEALIYNRLLNIKISKSLLVSFAANLTSFVIGLIVL